MRLLAPLALCLLAPTLASCDRLAPEEAGEASAAADRLPECFASPEEALARVQEVRTAADRLRLLDLMYGANRAQNRTVELTRDRWVARIEFAEALAAHFGEEAGEHAADDLGAAAFATLVGEAGPIQVAGRRATSSYTTDAGAEQAVVLFLVRDGWAVSADTLAGGEAIDDFWFARWQAWLHGRIRSYRRVTESVNAGEYATVAEALTALQEALDGPLPVVGGMSMFGALPQRTGERGPPAGDQAAEDDDE